MFKFSRVKFRLFAAWNVHIVFFSCYFCSVDVLVVWIVSGRLLLLKTERVPVQEKTKKKRKYKNEKTSEEGRDEIKGRR